MGCKAPQPPPNRAQALDGMGKPEPPPPPPRKQGATLGDKTKEWMDKIDTLQETVGSLGNQIVELRNRIVTLEADVDGRKDRSIGRLP